MRGAVNLFFTPEAEQDLGHLGRLSRSLVASGIRDEVAGQTRLASVHVDDDAVQKVISGDGAVPGDQTASQPWSVIPVGDYRAVVRLINPGEAAEPTAWVARVFDEDQLRQLFPDLPELR
jgi:hypothetical protein